MIRFKQKNISYPAPNKTINYLWQQVAASPPDADATAFLTAAGITDPTISTATNEFVVDLKGYGIWTKMKAIYPFVGGTATTHKFNLKNPVDTNAAFRLVFVGGWTHSANGALPNGTNAYAKTSFIPGTEMDSANNSVSFYSRTNSDSGIDIGAWDGSRLYGLYARRSGRTFYYSGTTGLNPLNSNGLGFYCGFIDASNMYIYKNGAATSSGPIPSLALSTRELYIGAENGNGSEAFFSNKECAFASLGGSKLTTTEASNLYTAVQAFQTTLGRQV